MIAAPISELAQKIADANLEGPALVLIGKAMAGAMVKSDPKAETRQASA